LEPTAAYFVRRDEPMLPTITRPGWTPRPARIHRLAARLTPHEVIEVLNLYLEAMVDVIGRYQGTIDEIIGDGILVIFGAPVACDDHADKAVACGLAMQLAMRAVNQRLVATGVSELEMGGHQDGDLTFRSAELEALGRAQDAFGHLLRHIAPKGVPDELVRGCPLARGKEARQKQTGPAGSPQGRWLPR
jgi:Adenylate and Guanylate cyclase catalytic domain